MGRSRVVSPETATLPISDGDTITIVRELNAREYLDYIRAAADRQPFAKGIAYLIGWTLCGVNEQPLGYALAMEVEERRAIIGSLDKATWREILAAIDRHEAAIDEERDAKKKTLSGASASSPTSESVGP